MEVSFTVLTFDLPHFAEVFDILGRKAFSSEKKQYTAGINQSINLDVSSLAAGVYVYKVIIEDAGLPI
ncbi:MAG: T9SS type A sorting domain-containing protein [Rhodothermales bacterium]